MLTSGDESGVLPVSMSADCVVILCSSNVASIQTIVWNFFSIYFLLEICFKTYYHVVSALCDQTYYTVPPAVQFWKVKGFYFNFQLSWRSENMAAALKQSQIW